MSKSRSSVSVVIRFKKEETAVVNDWGGADGWRKKLLFRSRRKSVGRAHNVGQRSLPARNRPHELSVVGCASVSKGCWKVRVLCLPAAGKLPSLPRVFVEPHVYNLTSNFSYLCVLTGCYGEDVSESSRSPRDAICPLFQIEAWKNPLRLARHRPQVDYCGRTPWQPWLKATA